MDIKINKLIKENNLPNLLLLYGSENYLRNQFKSKAVDLLSPTKDSMNFNKFVNQTGNVDESMKFISEFMSIATTVPFFSDKRVILCENTGFFKNKFEAIPSFLERVPNTTYIIFSEIEISKATKAYKTISKLGFVEEYELPTPRDLRTWVISKVKANNLNIEPSVADNLLSRCADDMNNINNELDKLISYCLLKERITIEDIDAVCISSYEENIFNIVNAIAEKNKRQALLEYTYLYKLRTNPRSLFSLLTNRFLLIFNITIGLKNNLSTSTISKELGIKNSYALEKNLKTARLFSEEKLRKILDLSADYNKKINTGMLDEQTGIEMFILKCLEN